MHLWGDKDFDWKSLDEAGHYLEKQCRRWARLGVHTKEKYGTLRVDTCGAYWSSWPIHGWVYPGHHYYQWPRWMISKLEYPMWNVFSFMGVTSLVNTYQRSVLKHFWKKAANKWPHIAEEILDEYEWETGQ